MARISFKDIKFSREGKGSFARIRADFLKIFRFYIEISELEKIGRFEIKEGSIVFNKKQPVLQQVSQSAAEKKFSVLLAKGFEKLRNSINLKPAVYVHRNSGIPAIGHIAFGIVDRGTNIIELKPITGCNIKCIYCSVNEDARPVDFVVECDYLLEEVKKLAKLKECNDLEVHIGTQGEPLYYAPLIDLIKGLRKMPEIKEIAISTNATMLTKKLVDELIGAGLTQFNISINAMGQKPAESIAGTPYNLKHVLEMINYIAKQDVNLILTPVWIPGVNDLEMPKLIEYAKKIGAGKKKGIPIGIQNYLEYPYGRKPVTQMSFEEFYKKLAALEKEHNIKLIFKSGGYHKTKELPKPFKKGDIIEAMIVCPGRLRNEMIAVAKNKTISAAMPVTMPAAISIIGCNKKVGSKVKLRITRTKHNIYAGLEV